MSRTRKRLVVGTVPFLETLESANELLLELAEAARDARCDGSVDELRKLQRLCMRTAREASDAALCLSGTITATEQLLEIDRLAKSVEP
jgi:hypothetical protein